MSSTLRISGRFLIEQLFAGVIPQPDVNLLGCAYNPEQDLVVLIIEGPEIPEGDVVAYFRKERLTLEFRKIEP